MDIGNSDRLPPTLDGGAVPSEARPSYIPQFSRVNSLILNRLKGDASIAVASDSRDAPSTDTSSGNRESTHVKAQPAQRMSSTLALSGVSDVANHFVYSQAQNLKRKRNADGAVPDFTQSTIQFRAPVAPAKQVLAIDGPQKCSKCDQSTWTPSNGSVTCHGCHSSWHQQCLSSAVSPSVADFSKYFCPACEIGGHDDQGPGSVEIQDRRHQVDGIRRNRLSNLPQGVVPAKPELVGFLASQASDSEALKRTEYFCGKKRTDLLNILSLCDQLKPQLLVDILVSVSKKHPDLPIFDDPDWRAILPGISALKRSSTAKGSRVTERPRHGHTLVHPKESRKPKGHGKALKQVAMTQTERGVAEEGENGENNGSIPLPPTWPKAGDGLYAKLPPEDEDRAFLQDDNDEEAFSHFMVDRFGKQMVVEACA